MRVLAIATVLIAASSLHPSFAQDEGKAPVAVPQTVPTQTDKNSPPPQDQRTGSDQPKPVNRDADHREVGRDWRMHPEDGDRMGHMGHMGNDHMGRDDREMGRDWRMHRDREADRDRETEGNRYRERGDRDWDRRDRRSYYDDDRPRRRVKVCVEYENGDEYCRYKD